MRDALASLTNHLDRLVVSFDFAKDAGVLGQKLLFLEEAIA